jgi:hypothetical protein
MPLSDTSQKRCIARALYADELFASFSGSNYCDKLGFGDVGCRRNELPLDDQRKDVELGPGASAIYS